MNRCSNCVHFVEPERVNRWAKEQEARYDAEHPERRPRANWRECALTRNYVSDAEARDTKAIAVDGSEYAAVLLVDPEFGCVQWEGPAT